MRSAIFIYLSNIEKSWHSCLSVKTDVKSFYWGYIYYCRVITPLIKFMTFIVYDRHYWDRFTQVKYQLQNGGIKL